MQEYAHSVDAVDREAVDLQRSIIEIINDQLKNVSQIVHTHHRSLTNFVVNLLAGLIAYTHQPLSNKLAHLFVDPLLHLGYHSRGLEVYILQIEGNAKTDPERLQVCIVQPEQLLNLRPTSVMKGSGSPCDRAGYGCVQVYQLIPD